MKLDVNPYLMKLKNSIKRAGWISTNLEQIDTLEKL